LSAIIRRLPGCTWQLSAIIRRLPGCTWQLSAIICRMHAITPEMILIISKMIGIIGQMITGISEKMAVSPAFSVLFCGFPEIRRFHRILGRIIGHSYWARGGGSLSRVHR
jgi:hypothetical protein